MQGTRAVADTALRSTSLQGEGKTFLVQKALWTGASLTWVQASPYAGVNDKLLWQAAPSYDKAEVTERMVEARKRRCEYSRDMAWRVAVHALQGVATEQDGEEVVRVLRGTWRPWMDMFMLLTEELWDTHIWSNPTRASQVRRNHPFHIRFTFVSHATPMLLAFLSHPFHMLNTFVSHSFDMLNASLSHLFMI